MKKIISNNEKETFDFGAALGRHCRGGDVFALCGKLGAGKTKLAQGLAKGLGVKGRVNSPTFNILKIYRVGDKTNNKRKKVKFFCHIDAYRLKSAKDLTALGVKEIFNSPETVTAVEWAEKIEKILPNKTKIIKIKQLKENKRGIIIR